ncbi:MAG TPA: hypothetical protein VGX00_04960 [Thermoplasmata archaeon]|nr:hypothetical protein [Thermoplasmata archaeon]
MPAAQTTTVSPSENFASPPIVHFWGPVREHVNRVAAEFAQRIARDPFWLNVQDPRTASRSAEVLPITGARVFELPAGADGRLVLQAGEPGTTEGSAVEGTTSPSEGAHVVLRLPPVSPMVLRPASDGSPHGAFVLSNIDRLEDLNPIFGDGNESAIVTACRERSVVLVLTSEGLVPVRQLESEYSVEVISMPEEEWWEAEVRAGVPHNAGGDTPGPDAGGYATGFPSLLPDNPLRARYAGEPMRETPPENVYPFGAEFVPFEDSTPAN